MGEQAQAESYRVITSMVSGEITERKSRFLAVMAPVESEEEALAFVESVRKRHYDARHHCFAWIVGKNAGQERCSDDGEPSGTAGRPILEVLRGLGLTNVVAVVTRYFGGTLLGTGGLVRAYTQALQEAASHCTIVTMRRGVRYRVTAEYTLVGKLQHLFGKRGITVEDTVYTDKAAFAILVPAQEEETLKKDMMELAAARVRIERLACTYYADKA